VTSVTAVGDEPRVRNYRIPNGRPDPSPALARKSPARRGPTLSSPMASSCRVGPGRRVDLAAQARH
jgi:hypothetical protein